MLKLTTYVGEGYINITDIDNISPIEILDLNLTIRITTMNLWRTKCRIQLSSSIKGLLTLCINPHWGVNCQHGRLMGDWLFGDLWKTGELSYLGIG